MVRNSLAIFLFSSLVVGGETENMWGAGLRRPGWLVAGGKYIEWPLTSGWWWRSKNSMGLARISAAPLNLLRRWRPWLDFGAREVYRFIWSHHDVLSSPGFSCFWCGADDVSPRLPSYTTWLKNCTFLEGLGESWDLNLNQPLFTLWRANDFILTARIQLMNTYELEPVFLCTLLDKIPKSLLSTRQSGGTHEPECILTSHNLWKQQSKCDQINRCRNVPNLMFLYH